MSESLIAECLGGAAQGVQLAGLEATDVQRLSELETIGPYRVLAKLGQGAQASVFRCSDPQRQRDVAIKVYVGLDARTSARFEREVRALARLNHPNVVRILDAGNEAGRPYLVLDLIEGHSLSERIRQQGSLSAAEAIAIALKLLEALDCIHSQGLVHRDVKPSNVLLSEEQGGEPVLGDFGLIRGSVADRDLRLTQTGYALGTHGYMAPEQMKGDWQAADCRVDLYALGATVLAMVTGRQPDLTSDALVDRAIQLGVDSALLSVCRRSMAANPSDRFQSAAELASALRRVQQAATAKHSWGRRPVLWGGILASALGLWALFASVQQDVKDPPPPFGPTEQVSPIPLESSDSVLPTQSTRRPPSPAPNAFLLEQPEADRVYFARALVLKGRAPGWPNVWWRLEKQTSWTRTPVVNGRFTHRFELDTGTHTLWLGERPGGDSHSVVFHVDTAPPQIAVKAPAPGDTVSPGTVDVRGSVQERLLAVLEVQGQAASWETDGTFAVKCRVDAATKEIVVRARDVGGLESIARIPIVVSSGPLVVEFFPPLRWVDSSHTRVRLRGRVSLNTQALSIAGRNVALDSDFQFALQLPAPPQGPLTFEVRVRGKGNREQFRTARLNVDRTPPRIVLEQLAKLRGGNAIAVIGRIEDEYPTASVEINGQRVGLQGLRFVSTQPPLGKNESRPFRLVTWDVAGNQAVFTKMLTADLFSPPRVRFSPPLPETAIGPTQRTLTLKGLLSERIHQAKLNGRTLKKPADLELELPVTLQKGDNRFELELTNANGTSLRRWNILWLPTELQAPKGLWWKPTQRQLWYAAKLGKPVAFQSVVGLRFVLIPPGLGSIGSPDDEEGRTEREVQARVRMDEGFYLSDSELDLAGYLRKPRRSNATRFRVPWTGTVADAGRFCRWLTQHSPRKLQFRLPHAEEWEYACRAGSREPYSWGSDPEAIARYANGTKCRPGQGVTRPLAATGADSFVSPQPVGVVRHAGKRGRVGSRTGQALALGRLESACPFGTRTVYDSGWELGVRPPGNCAVQPFGATKRSGLSGCWRFFRTNPVLRLRALSIAEFVQSEGAEDAQKHQGEDVEGGAIPLGAHGAVDFAAPSTDDQVRGGHSNPTPLPQAEVNAVRRGRDLNFVGLGVGNQHALPLGGVPPHQTQGGEEHKGHHGRCGVHLRPPAEHQNHAENRQKEERAGCCPALADQQGGCQELGSSHKGVERVRRVKGMEKFMERSGVLGIRKRLAEDFFQPSRHEGKGQKDPRDCHRHVGPPALPQAKEQAVGNRSRHKGGTRTLEPSPPWGGRRLNSDAPK